MARPHATHHAFDGDPEHALPEFTTPQGTQADGVAHGHEERDTNLSAIFKWFTAVFVATVLTIVVLAVAYRFWENQVKQADVVPPMLRHSQTPPEPRLIPNPVDDAPTGLDPIRGPIERHAEYEILVNEELQKIKLLDGGTGLPTIPDDVAERVIQRESGQGTQPAPAAARPGIGPGFWAQPSDPSGGTVFENHLR